MAILSDIKHEIAESRAETKREIAALETKVQREIAETKREIAALETKVQREIAALKSDMKWFFGAIVVLAGLVLAALKLFQ